jgi:hypothetical protein
MQTTGARTGNSHNSNRIGTYLRASARTGFAPDWEGGVGEIILYREDGVSVTEENVDDYWVFLSSLMLYDMSEFGGRRYTSWSAIKASDWISPQGLTRFIETLRRMEDENTAAMSS